jgi:hypothetical protein
MLLNLLFMKYQMTFIYGRLNLATKHIAIISSMQIRMMIFIICTLLYFIKWRRGMRYFNISKFKRFIKNAITLRNIKSKS